jgi:hypothetical protein
MHTEFGRIRPLVAARGPAFSLDVELGLRFPPLNGRIRVEYSHGLDEGRGRRTHYDLKRRLYLVHKLLISMAPRLLPEILPC